MKKTAKTLKPGTRKIMVQLWIPLAEALRRNCRALHTQRDAYLSDLLGSEIEELAKEMTVRNPDGFRERVASRKLDPRTKVTLLLRETVADNLDRILGEMNVPRDSFINRVIFFLFAKRAHLRWLEVAHRPIDTDEGTPIDNASGFLRDPFFHFRIRNDGAFYTLACFPDGPAFRPNGPNLFALNTCMHPDEWAKLVEMEERLASLGDFDVNTILEQF